MKILITGTAGFIGFHLAKRLLIDGHVVVGLDNITDYYDLRVKYGRLAETGIDKSDIEYGKIVESSKYSTYRFIQLDLQDKEGVDKLFKDEHFDKVCNLAAQAGVRYSISNPDIYIQSNVVGFLNILEACRHTGISDLSYASSSSVYGLNAQMPFSTKDSVNHPMSLYAASKKSNELMAHTYSHLYGLRTTGLRFFTVYGSWGRPDMALFLFTEAILKGESIKIFNKGEMLRDFTYIDDIVEGLVRVILNPAKPNLNWAGQAPDPSSAPSAYKIYNIGNNSPVRLLDFVSAIEHELGMEAHKEFLPLQDGDVPSTYADVSDLVRDLGYKPNTEIKIGVKQFVDWYRDFYQV